MVKNKKYKNLDKKDLRLDFLNEFRLELALIAYKGIFSNPEYYKIAVDHYNRSQSRSISQTISEMCFNAADEFIKKLD